MIDPQEDFVHDTTSGSAEQSRSRLSHQEWNDREHIIDRFEEEWQAGQSPQIDAYLRMFPNDTAHTLLRELVSIDIEYRTKRGEQLCLDKYFSAFPILLDDPVNVVRLVQEDYALRNRISTKSIDSGCAKQSKHSNALHHSLQNDHFPAIAGYDVIGEIGRGSMGIVYRARQIGLNRTVAIKVTRDSLRADRTRVSRFGIEAAAIATLDHPNIIKIFEVGENNGQLFFSMELADEGSLTDRLKKGPISIREASELVMLIARGVHHAHVRGVVHRDLKPLNIVLVSKSDSVGDNKSESCALLDFVQPKVTDFGLAKVLDSEYGPTVTGDIFGTPGYMAPEQLSDTSAIVGPSTDIYGLGAILYELLTGCPPFRGIDVLSTLEQVRNSQPKSPRQLMPSIPRDLETICLKCLEKEPQRRFLSAELLAEDLRRFIAGEPVLARPVSSFEKCWRLCRRNPLLSCLLSTIFLILFAGMITVVHYATVANSSSEKYLHQLQHARASLVTSQLWRVASSLGQDPGESWRLLQDEESIPRTDRDFVWGMYANHCQSISSILPIKTDGVQLFTVLAVSPNERLIAAADNEFGKD